MAAFQNIKIENGKQAPTDDDRHPHYERRHGRAEIGWRDGTRDG